MKLSYRVAQKSDYDKVLPMAEKELNSGIAYEEYMKNIFDSLGKNTFGIVAFNGEELAGFAFCEKGMFLTGGREDLFAEIMHLLFSVNINFYTLLTFITNG